MATGPLILTTQTLAYERAGWPTTNGTFHAIRQFFATSLITDRAEPQEVQHFLRHKTLRITLETYVHWWPKRERRQGIMGAILGRGILEA